MLPDGGSAALLKHFAAGAAATASACLLTNPIEIVKTRLQLNGEMRSRLVYRSPYHAVSLMLREEGPSAFFKGLRPALLYQISMFVCIRCRRDVLKGFPCVF
jgi:solute carrier family 25 protein 34/35